MGDSASKTLEQHDSVNQQQAAAIMSAAFKRPREDVSGQVSENSVQQESSSVTSSPAVSPSTVRKKHRLEGERICRVCGDKAAAHHFDVITCESCKTFFRRNANKTQKVCQFEGCCQITVNTRRFCPACRLRKCFNIGMRADLIMDEEERKARLEKIRTNRMIRIEAARKEEQMRQNENSKSPCIMCSNDADGISLILQEPDTAHAVQSLLEDMSRERTLQDSGRQEEEVCRLSDSVGTKCASCSSSGAGSLTSSPCQLQEMNPSVSSTVSCDGIANIQSKQLTSAHDSLTRGDVQCHQCMKNGLDEVRVPVFHPVPKTLLPSDSCMFWTLTTEEEKMIKFLGHVFQKEVVQPHLSVPEALVTQMAQMCLDQAGHQAKHFGREIIRFIKQIPEYSALNVADHQALLKANGRLLIMLCTASFYSENKDGWVKDKGIFTEELYAQLLQDEALAAMMKRFSLMLHRIFGKDLEGFGLLVCTTYFDPLALAVSDRQSVNAFHDKYALLQKHHLESKHSYLFASQYREAIEDWVRHCKLMTAKLSQTICKYESDMIPMMAECFNLI